MTVEEFLERHPEFSKAGALVASALDFAAARVSESAWGDLYEHALALRAACWLATHPHGKSLRTEDDTEKKSRYQLEYEALVREQGFGLTVI